MRAAGIFFFILGMITLAYAYDPDYDEPPEEISFNDSWKLGRPDNIPETEVIIMNGSDCGCPQ